MRIGLAQIRSVTGEVEANVAHHIRVAKAAVTAGAELVVFPELSLTNYEPEVATALPLGLDDERLRPLRDLAEETSVRLAVGAPVSTTALPAIAMIILDPERDPTVIGKGYLHEDERQWFSEWAGSSVWEGRIRVGMAICYEISVDEHLATLQAAGPDLYLASVAKTPKGMEAARRSLSDNAKRLGVPGLLVNSVGSCEGVLAGGGSCICAPDGTTVAALGPSAEGVLVFDTESGRTYTVGLWSEDDAFPSVTG